MNRSAEVQISDLLFLSSESVEYKSGLASLENGKSIPKLMPLHSWLKQTACWPREAQAHSCQNCWVPPKLGGCTRRLLEAPEVVLFSEGGLKFYPLTSLLGLLWPMAKVPSQFAGKIVFPIKPMGLGHYLNTLFCSCKPKHIL